MGYPMPHRRLPRFFRARPARHLRPAPGYSSINPPYRSPIGKTSESRELTRAIIARIREHYQAGPSSCWPRNAICHFAGLSVECILLSRGLACDVAVGKVMAPRSPAERLSLAGIRQRHAQPFSTFLDRALEVLKIDGSFPVRVALLARAVGQTERQVHPNALCPQ